MNVSSVIKLLALWCTWMRCDARVFLWMLPGILDAQEVSIDSVKCSEEYLVWNFNLKKTQMPRNKGSWECIWEIFQVCYFLICSVVHTYAYETCTCWYLIESCTLDKITIGCPHFKYTN